jgi:carbon storage regulator CsrA
MLVLSARVNDKVRLPDVSVCVRVVSVQGNIVRLGFEAPDEVRILRDGQYDRVAEWGRPEEEREEEAPSLSDIQKLLDKRLEIARAGVNAAQTMLKNGAGSDAEMILEKLDEDLHLLRRRVRHEFEQVDSLSVTL